MTAEQIEKLAYHAPTKRDKTYIWVAFQSGLDVSTVLSLSWGHIEKEFDNPPMGAILLRDLERRKEKGRRFTSTIYRTAIRHLKSYLRERFGEAILDPEKRRHEPTTSTFLTRIFQRQNGEGRGKQGVG